MKIKFYIPNKNYNPIDCGEIEFPTNRLTLQDFKNMYISEYLYYKKPFVDFVLDTNKYKNFEGKKPAKLYKFDENFKENFLLPIIFIVRIFTFLENGRKVILYL